MKIKILLITVLAVIATALLFISCSAGIDVASVQQGKHLDKAKDCPVDKALEAFMNHPKPEFPTKTETGYNEILYETDTEIYWGYLRLNGWPRLNRIVKELYKTDRAQFYQLKEKANRLDQHQAENIGNYDFSPLWLDNRTEYLGYIGDDYQRLYMWLDAVRKISDTEYQVKGRSKVKLNECDFSGTITLKTISEFTEEEFDYGVDDWMKGKFSRQGTVVADFLFEEDKNQKGSGIFRGTLQSKWYVDLDGKLKYDDIGEDADRYANNQFSGTWTSYSTKSSKKCAWGHYRIPDSGDLDIGAAEFSVNPKYSNNGWDENTDIKVKFKVETHTDGALTDTSNEKNTRI